MTGDLNTMQSQGKQRYSREFLTVTISTVVLMVLCLIFAPSSAAYGALSGSLPFAAILAIAGLGQMLVVQQGGFDLSVPGVVSLAVVIASHYPAGNDAQLLPAVLLAFACAITAGALNGILVGFIRLNAIVATIGMNALLHGGVFAVSGGVPRIMVMSRGRIVETLTGADVVEERIVSAAVHAASTAKTRNDGQEAYHSAQFSGWRHLVQLDNAPTLPLLIVIILLALFGYSQNPNFLSPFNLANILLLATALGFVALGQTVALLLGAIDLSVGPLMGFVVVISSFFINDGASSATILAGFVLMFGAAILVGLVNGILIRYANFTAIAATLAIFIGLQGCSFLLRDSPGGYITYSVVGVITWKWGPVPVAFIVMVACALLAEFGLRSSRVGRQLRALGSDEESSRRIGLKTDRIYIADYVASAGFAAMGGVMLMAQIGVGDPQQGANYTLASITAAVLGGTSLRGGRGTFIGSMLGAVLATEALSIVTFLGLSQTYQYLFQGALVLIAALIYTTARGRRTT